MYTWVISPEIQAKSACQADRSLFVYGEYDDYGRSFQAYRQFLCPTFLGVGSGISFEDLAAFWDAVREEPGQIYALFGIL